MTAQARVRRITTATVVGLLVVFLGLLDTQAVSAAPNRGPVARLSVSPSTGTAPLTVTADGSASTDDQQVTSYAFTWGDGSARTGPGTASVVQHTYKATGTFSVTLTVKDASNRSSVVSKSVTVTRSTTPIDQRPTAALTVSPATGVVPFTTTADASGSTDDIGIASYRFDWGDGSPATTGSSATAQHQYTGAGSYTVTMTVTDTTGQTASQTRSVTGTNPTTPTDQRPTAALTVSPATGVVPFSTTADARGSTDDIGIASYRFDWGDGSPATTGSSATAQHQYTGAGSYTVTMTVTDTTGQTASQTRSVTGTNPGSTLKPTTVVVTFDDGVADQVTGLNAMKSAGLPATIYVNSAELGTSGYMSKSNLDTYAAAGMEIAGHTLHHPHLLSLSATDARREICNDRAALTGMGYKVTSFAYPYGEGSTNASVRQYVQDCGYNDARGVSGILSPGYGCSGCPTAETIPPQDLWNIRQPQSVQQGTTLAQLQNYVTQAENDNGGLVPLLFHHICSGCDEYSMTPANFSAFVSWLAARPGTTVVRTMDQVIGGAVKPVVTVP